MTASQGFWNPVKISKFEWKWTKNSLFGRFFWLRTHSKCCLDLLLCTSNSRSKLMSTDLGNNAWPSTWSYQVSKCVPAIHGPNPCTKKSLNLHIMYQQFMVHHMPVTRFLGTGVWIANCWYTFVHLLLFHEKRLRGENAKRLNKLMYKNWFLICVIYYCSLQNLSIHIHNTWNTLRFPVV